MTQEQTRVGIVIGPDTRQQVMQTTVFPYSAIGRVTMKFPNGKSYSGTGTMIDDRHVLTAGHNLYGANIGGNATTVTFTPAQNGNAAPFGAVAAAQYWVTDEWRNKAAPSPLESLDGAVADYTPYLEDFGLIRLTRSLDQIGYCTMWPLADRELATNPMSVTGYPGDLAKVRGVGTMWSAGGMVTPLGEEWLQYTISTYQGESGSGLLFRRGTGWSVAGIHVLGDSALNINVATRLTVDVVNTIQAWIG